MEHGDALKKLTNINMNIDGIKVANKTSKWQN
jgi:hypothetical protein